jgi:hypothetical protein
MDNSLMAQHKQREETMLITPPEFEQHICENPSVQYPGFREDRFLELPLELDSKEMKDRLIRWAGFEPGGNVGVGLLGENWGGYDPDCIIVFSSKNLRESCKDRFAISSRPGRELVG